jgi:hypothetical protein
MDAGLRRTPANRYRCNSRIPDPRFSNPEMIQHFLLTSSIRRITPLAWMRQGVVCPGTRIFGAYDAGGRAP